MIEELSFISYSPFTFHSHSQIPIQFKNLNTQTGQKLKANVPRHIQQVHRNDKTKNLLLVNRLYSSYLIPNSDKISVI